jgi:hypothetical protein
LRNLQAEVGNVIKQVALQSARDESRVNDKKTLQLYNKRLKSVIEHRSTIKISGKGLKEKQLNIVRSQNSLADYCTIQSLVT